VSVSLTKEEEKLELIINTNGAIKPKKALNEALEIAYKSFASIASLINQEKSKTAAPAPAA
jgi:DNA-directed RNA polymerase alpha subunit